MGRKFYELVLVLVLAVFSATAQTGEIRGTITEKGKKDAIAFASIAAFSNGIQVQGTKSDFDGNYSIKPLNPGTYEIRATYVGYQPVSVAGVIVSVNQTAFVNVEMGKGEGVTLKEKEVIDYKVPLLDVGTTTRQTTITREEIEAAPTRSVAGVVTQAAGTFQKDEDEGINIRGSRDDATAYYVDGIKVRGNPGISQKGTEQITVIQGGIPAQYGDATGGIISISTRGPSNVFGGGIEAATSEYLDAYGYNLVSANVTGPIYSRRDSTGKRTGQSIAGFFVAAEYQYDKDPNPSVIPIYKVKDDILNDVREHPLIHSPNSSNYIHRSSFFTLDSLETQKYRENVAADAIRVNGKLDLRATKNLTLTLGASTERTKDREYVDTYALMNYDNNPQKKENGWRAFAKLTQRFSSEESDKSTSAIKNAFYTIQFDYSRNSREDQNVLHKKNYFDYGYVGKFHQYSLPFYQQSTFQDVNGLDSNVLKEIGVFPVLFSYEPGTQNPYTSNYTSDYYALTQPFGISGFQNSSDNVVLGGGLINGDNRAGLNVYGLWGTPGRVVTQYAISDNRQARVSASGSADIKNHNIVIGMEYEQRIDRGYNISPNNLWLIMRQLGNQHLTGIDTNNASVNYANGFTWVDYAHGNYTQSKNADGEYVRGFYENARDKFNVGYNDTLQTDSYAPSEYNLSMFTPDELFNSGNSLIRYYGYDYTGDHQTNESWDLKDFFVNKDENNNFLRKIDAFRPTYLAGYIQDNFIFNDIRFNIGVRVDRFDANQKVLKDPYSLYEIHKAGDPETQSLGNVPANIGSNYAVYVNNTLAPTQIVGYRNGSSWYDRTGTPVTDLSTLQGTGTSNAIQPYLTNLDDYQKVKVNPNAFTDYTPQVSVMPRVAFSFPISDEAYFSAHYDLLTQRPQNANLIRFDPIDYYNWSQGVSANFANPNLKPEKTTEYEINFQQKLSRSSAFSIAAFYKELRDNIQFINYDFAFPIKYTAYGNIDFGTVKGLTFGYDLRRTSNVRTTVSYTLQFADGTGSDVVSNSGILSQAGQTNLREIKPLSFDQRHTFVTSFDFHYESGKDYNGPVWGNKQIFANAGLNVVFRAGSGTPYTRQSNITPTADFTTTANSRKVIAGSINGSRYPWNFRIDAKLDKDFEIKTGKKKDGDARKSLYANVYLQVLNVLNTENVTAVYAATGSPSDLSSTLGS